MALRQDMGAALQHLLVEAPCVLLEDPADEPHLAIVGRQNGCALCISSFHQSNHGPARNQFSESLPTAYAATFRHTQTGYTLPL